MQGGHHGALREVPVSCGEQRRCICGGDIETTLRANAVYFVKGTMEQITQASIPVDLGPDEKVLLVILPVRED